MELGQVQSFSNSANVLWSDGRRSRDKAGKDILGVAKYKLNEADDINIPQHATLNNLIIDLGQYPDAKNSNSQLSAIITNLKDIETALGKPGPDYPTQKDNLTKAIASLTGMSGINAGDISGLQVVADALPVGTAPPNNNMFTNTVGSTAIFTKNETPPGVITTTKTLKTTDILNATVTIGTNQQTFTHNLGGGSLDDGKGGKYYNDQTKTLERITQNAREIQ